jgi:hypothetical protein
VLAGLNRQVINTGKSVMYQAIGIELPVFIAVGAITLPSLIVPLVSKTYGDAMVAKCP